MTSKKPVQKPTSFSDSRSVKITGGQERSAPVYVLDRTQTRVQVGTARIIQGNVQGERQTTIGKRFYERTTESLPVHLKGMQGKDTQNNFEVKAPRNGDADWLFQQPADIQKVLFDAGFDPVDDGLHFQRGGLELKQEFVMSDVRLPDVIGDYDVRYWEQALKAVGKQPEMAISPMIILSYGVEPAVATTATVGWFRWVCTNGARRFIGAGGYKSGHNEFDFDHFMRWCDRIRRGMGMGDYTSNLIDDGYVKPGDVLVDPIPNRDSKNLKDIVMGKLQIPTASALCDAAKILEASSYRVREQGGKYVPACHPKFHTATLTEIQEQRLIKIAGTLDVTEARKVAGHLQMLCESMEPEDGVYMGQLENALSSYLTEVRMDTRRNATPMVQATRNVGFITNIIRELGQMVWSPFFIQSLDNQIRAMQDKD